MKVQLDVLLVALIFGGALFTSIESRAQTFGGNDCLDNCEGHAAGYRWAEENNITSASQCSGNSNSFNEGCETYVSDPSRGSDEDDDGNEIE